MTKSELQFILDEVSQRNVILEAEIRTVKAERDNWKAECESIRLSLEDTVKDLNQKNDKAYEMRKEIEDLSEICYGQKAEIEKFSDAKTILGEIDSRLGMPIDILNRRIDALESELGMAKDENDCLRDNINFLEEKVKRTDFLDGKVQAYETILKTAKPDCLQADPWEVKVCAE